MRRPPGRCRSTAAIRWRASARSTRPPIPAKFQQAISHFVQPGYFEFARTPIIAGRAFTDADNRPEARVIIIDDLLAAQLFPNGNAVGQRMLARVITPEPRPSRSSASSSISATPR